MSTPVRISACSTLYNDKPALHAFLDSFLPQFPSDGELVIVDAGSTDGAWDALQGRAEEDGRIVPLQDPGCTRGSGRDQAWRAGKGPIVLHIDCDRTWRPDAWATIETLLPGLAASAVKLRSPLGQIGLGGYLILRSHLEAIDGYDPSLQYFEDVDLERRLRAKVGIRDVTFDGYTHDSKATMRRIRTNVRYYWHMFRDGARIGDPFLALCRPSLRRPRRYPFLFIGALGYIWGLTRPQARWLREGGVA